MTQQQQKKSVHPRQSLVPADLEPAMFSWLSNMSLVPLICQQCILDGAASKCFPQGLNCTFFFPS